MSQLAIVWSTNDRGHRERLHALLADLRWHTQTEMKSAGGDRYGARLLELRRGERLDVEVRCVGQGAYQYRLRGVLAEAHRAKSWKARALAAEARVAELEQQLGS